MDELLSRVNEAVEEGVRARSAYYASIDLEDDQALGAPAAEASIQQLEQKLGRALPPSYRAFLRLHDGWKMVDGVSDLLPVRDLLTGPRAEKIRAWQAEVAKSGDARAAKGLVIGWADINPTRLLLLPDEESGDGEWPLLMHYKDEEVEYASFLEWLEESAADYEALASGDTGEEDEDEA
jgi:hypothetical protein